MDLKEIKELIALMKRNELSVFKMEKEGFKITLKKGGEVQSFVPMPGPPLVPAAAAPPSQPAASAPAASAAEPVQEIVSPMVGTFYLAQGPESEPFVEVGQTVTADTVVCIIEAMKVMNEIKAEMSGTIAEVVAENGKPVQFGQPLFRLK